MCSLLCEPRAWRVPEACDPCDPQPSVQVVIQCFAKLNGRRSKRVQAFLSFLFDLAPEVIEHFTASVEQFATWRNGFSVARDFRSGSPECVYSRHWIDKH